MSATAAYRCDQDLLGAFLGERCKVFPEARCKLSNLYGAFLEWTKASGEPETLSQRRFASVLRDRGFHTYVNDGTWFKGLTLDRQDTDEARAF